MSADLDHKRAKKPRTLHTARFADINMNFEQFPCFLVGSNRATLVEMNVLHPVGIVVFEDYVYWIDRESRNVMKIKKGGDIQGSAVQAAVDDLSDMIVVDARKSTGRDITLVLHCQLTNSSYLSPYSSYCNIWENYVRRNRVDKC